MPEKRAEKLTLSLSMCRRTTARSAMFNTTLPSFTALCGTCTPGMPASTRMCGVSSLSLIHSTRARSRYGRWLVMRKVSSVMG
ncbi:hypothetical protein D3C72_2271390 [compost metagenome]